MKFLLSLTYFKVEPDPCEQKFISYLLSKLSSLKTTEFKRAGIHETLTAPNIEASKIYSLEVILESSWMLHILWYVHEDELPLYEEEARKVWKQIAKYTLLVWKIYKMGRASLMLWCLEKHETINVFPEVHNRSYIGGKDLGQKLIKTGYYWHTLMKDIIAFVKKCDQCQMHGDLPHALTKLLRSMMSPWPFY